MSLTTSTKSCQQSDLREFSDSNSQVALAVPGISLLSLDGVTSHVGYGDTGSTVSYTFDGNSALDIQSKDTPASEEDQEEGVDKEGEEARDHLVALSNGATIGFELDRVIVSDFLDSDSSNAPPAPSSHGIPLRRTDTIDSIRSASGQTSLGRSTTTSSTWSVALTYTTNWTFTLEGWCKFVQDHPSLRSAEIVKVDRYYQRGLIRHRFLVFQIRRKNKPNDIFLRLDRRAKDGISAIGFLVASGVTPANDCALLAADEKRAAQGNTPANVGIVREASLTFSNARTQPTLHHLERILDAMSIKMTKYQLTKENCWLFCAVCLINLFDTFGGDLNLGKLNHAGLPAAPKLRAHFYTQIWALPLLHTISTPSDVHSITVSPNGNQIVSCHSDKSVRLWDVQTGTVAGKPFEGHAYWVRSSAFSPNGRCIVFGLADGTIRLWDIGTHTAVGEPLIGHGNAVASVAFSPDGEQIVSGSWDSTVRLWDRATGNTIGEPFQGHTGLIRSVTFSPDGRIIASGSDDKTVRLWNVVTGNTIAELVGHIDWVWSVAFSPDGQRIASGSDDCTIRIWNTITGNQICGLEGHTSWVRSVAFSPDGRYIASGSHDNSIRFWNATTGTAIGASLIEHSHHAVSVSFFPNGQRIVSCGDWHHTDKTIHIWDAPI